jgi:hypothetical protein
MYCKLCGHRTDEKTETCSKCGASLSSAVELTTVTKRRFRWSVVVGAFIICVIVFGVVPRFFLRTELESIGPTDKLRFLRAVQNSEYRRVGQREIRLEGQTLIVVWDLRWNALPESKQQQIVRIVGKAWRTVGGEDTRFRIEGEDENVALYTKGEAYLGSAQP